MSTRRGRNRATRATLAIGILIAPAAAQQITRMSVDTSGAQTDDRSFALAISGDGNVAAFDSVATNLVAGDTNGRSDVFVHDRTTGITERVSVDSSGVQGDGDSSNPVLSRDGNVVAFVSYATNLVSGDTNGVPDVFVHDRVTGVTERVSVDSAGAEGDDSSFGSIAISADGNVVAFSSTADNLVAGDANHRGDIFVHDRSTGVTERISVSTSGREANNDSYDPRISADGNVVAFRSYATTLSISDFNNAGDIFVRDRAKGTTRRVSISTSGVEANGENTDPALSGDGKVVAWTSQASNLVAGDTNGVQDVFVRDQTTGVTTRESVDSTGAEGDNDSFTPALSFDGQIVAFSSAASNLVSGDTNSDADVFLRDRSAGTTTLVTISCALEIGDSDSYFPKLPDDGSVVAFLSFATNLVAGDTNGVFDVFADDLTVPPILASWSNYGAGYPGTLGVPTLTASADPVFGTTLSIDAGNSSGIYSAGLVALGLASASIPTSAGGVLLVDPLTFTLLPLLPGGASIDADVPRDPSLYGLSVFLQVLELDAGATKGISFTPGLQLTIGQ